MSKLEKEAIELKKKSMTKKQYKEYLASFRGEAQKRPCVFEDKRYKVKHKKKLTSED